MTDISPQELNESIQQGKSIQILDVREAIEFHTFNIGGVHIPLGKLPESIEELDWNEETEIAVICQRGIRSKTACKLLEMAGYRQVRNLNGGLLAWRKTFNL
ncbi:MAG: hypothetical protein RI924_1425 [Bacteroidota bacterium]|jgi:rhodanese-related sulfurtransferase